MLIDDGALREEDGRWVAPDLARLAIPSSISVLLASRLDQLGATERQVIERAAVEGTVFHRGAIEALLDEPARQLAGESLGALLRKELIRQERTTFAGEDAFRFRHVLIRNAAYDGLPKQIRAELHERFADWLVVAAGDRSTEVEEVLGYHFEQAFRHRTEIQGIDETGMSLAARGGQLLASAGRRAVARGDAPAAVNLLERAGALLPEDAPERLELRLELADALHGAGDLQRVGEQLEAALAHAEQVGERRHGGACTARACLAPPASSTPTPRRSTTCWKRRSMLPRSSSASGTTQGSRGRCGESPTSTGCGAGSSRASRCSSGRSSTRSGQATSASCSKIRQALIRGAADRADAGRRGDCAMRGDHRGVGRDPLTEAVAANALAYLNAMAGRFGEARELTLAEPRDPRGSRARADAAHARRVDGSGGDAGGQTRVRPSGSGGVRTRRSRGWARKGISRRSPRTSRRLCTSRSAYDEAEELTTASESMTFPRRRHVADRLADGAREGRRRARVTSTSRRRWQRRRRQGGGDGLAASPRRCVGSAGRGAGRQRVRRDEARRLPARRSAYTRPREAWPPRAPYAPASNLAGGPSSCRLAARGRRYDERHRRAGGCAVASSRERRRARRRAP